MHDNHRILENRIKRELYQRIQPAVLVERIPLTVTAHVVDGEPIPLTELADATFEPITEGTPWGRPWGTTWFQVSGEIPQGTRLEHTEVVAELGFGTDMVGFTAEGSVYVDGRLRCGVHPARRWIPLDTVRVGSHIDFLLEAASNPELTRSFAPNPLGSPHTAGDQPLYTFGGIALVRFDPALKALAAEIELLHEAMGTLPRDSRRRHRLQFLFQRALDALDPAELSGTAGNARKELEEGLSLAAAPGSHQMSAIGHAHIDTAWLWPLRETRRKCARTFSNQIQLMEQYPEHRFVASQARQYAWVEQDHPELFSQITARVDEQRWLPVGGMWVEADMNLPSGESLMRQMIHGQRYFESRFGHRCTEVWIPDVFGYPGNLPQVFLAGGCNRFVTQKLSWNKQNRFPHHTFLWEGIDGTEVLAHFPPVDTYNAEIKPGELTRAVDSFLDHGWSDHSLLPFGHGDGGGGPTREMLERARLLSDLTELPRLRIEAPRQFFERVEAEVASRGAPRWRGELYFEMHRGTFTSQVKMKVGNRRCEIRLREAELWLASLGDDSHAANLDALWKRVLTQQFHDILPGTSIAWVHEDAEREHQEVLAAAEELITVALARLAGPGTAVANAAGQSRTAVVRSTDVPSGDGPQQILADGSRAFLAAARGSGVTSAVAMDTSDRVQVDRNRLANDSIAVTFDDDGRVVSIRDLRLERELIPRGSHGAELTLAPDTPVEYDAWDLEQWTAARAQPLDSAVSVEVTEAGPLVGAVRVRHEFGYSWVEQTFVLRADSARLDVELEVQWQACEQLLAISFPLDISAETAACEVQFGHEHRPTHANTSWDDAKFEVCAQRWVDMSEPSFGVAVINDGRYGYAVQHGGIRVSLLRAPCYPDPDADRGHHRTTVALLPHGPGLTEVLAEAEALNIPLRVFEGGTAHRMPDPILTLDDDRVQVSAIKLADDGSGDIVVRLWEATGDRVRVALASSQPLSTAVACNALEEPLENGPPLEIVEGELRAVLAPFSVITLRVQF